MKFLKLHLLDIPILVLFLKLCHATDYWAARLYPMSEGKGSFVELFGETIKSCVNTANYTLCNRNHVDTCGSANTHANSINTLETCVRIYSKEDCEGTPLMELRPGTLCHTSFSFCEINGKMMSIGGCPSTHQDFHHHSQGGTPVINFKEGQINSSNYPNHYNPNEEANWFITLPHSNKIRMTFLDFDIEKDGAICKDEVAISELATGEIIYEGCGQTLPPPVVSGSNQVRVSFKSDGVNNRKGFSLHWEKCRRCRPSSTARQNEVKCAEDQFACLNGTCIEDALHCNGKRDCGDGSDELWDDCAGKVACLGGEFKCKRDDMVGCVEIHKLCKLEEHCENIEDLSLDKCSKRDPLYIHRGILHDIWDDYGSGETPEPDLESAEERVMTRKTEGPSWYIAGIISTVLIVGVIFGVVYGVRGGLFRRNQGFKISYSRHV